MFIDISHYHVKVVLKNIGGTNYIAYPRDIEGSVLGLYIKSKRDIKKVMEDNYRALFDIEDTVVNVRVRWDNDTRGTYSTIKLHIRDFGRCPGLQSIWSSGCYNIDNRPYQELKPMTTSRKRKDFFLGKYTNIKWSIKNDIDLEDIIKDIELPKPMKLPKLKKAKIKQRTYGSYNTYATMTARSTNYVGNYGAYISTSNTSG